MPPKSSKCLKYGCKTKHGINLSPFETPRVLAVSTCGKWTHDSHDDIDISGRVMDLRVPLLGANWEILSKAALEAIVCPRFQRQQKQNMHSKKLTLPKGWNTMEETGNGTKANARLLITHMSQEFLKPICLFVRKEGYFPFCHATMFFPCCKMFWIEKNSPIHNLTWERWYPRIPQLGYAVDLHLAFHSHPHRKCVSAKTCRWIYNTH